MAAPKLKFRTLLVEQPAPVELAHIVLRSAKLDEAVDFYKKLLGMEMNMETPMSAVLSHDCEHHRIALLKCDAEQPNPLAPGLEHVAFKLRSMGELLGNYVRVKKLGIEPFMCVHHGGTMSAYYLDPDGVQVELFIDSQQLDLSLEELNSPKFMENPIGLPLDFDDLVERFERGDSIASLLERPEQTDEGMEKLFTAIMAARGSVLQNND